MKPNVLEHQLVSQLLHLRQLPRNLFEVRPECPGAGLPARFDRTGLGDSLGQFYHRLTDFAADLDEELGLESGRGACGHDGCRG